MLFTTQIKQWFVGESPFFRRKAKLSRALSRAGYQSDDITLQGRDILWMRESYGHTSVIRTIHHFFAIWHQFDVVCIIITLFATRLGVLFLKNITYKSIRKICNIIIVFSYIFVYILFGCFDENFRSFIFHQSGYYNQISD